MPVIGDLIMPNQDYFKVVSSEESKYRWHKESMSNTSSNNHTIALATRSTATFKILNNESQNLSRSYIQGTLATTAQTAYGWIAQDTLPFSCSVVLRLGSGARLVDVPNATKWVKIMKPLKTNLVDFLCRDDSTILHPTATTTTTANATQINSPQSSVIEPLHYTKTASATAGSYFFRIDLADIAPETLLSQDYDLCFGLHNVYLDITFDGATPSTFGAASAADPTSTPEAALGAMTISDFFLYTALQTNENLVKKVQDTYNSGELSVLTPYVFHNATPTAASQTFNIPYDASNGPSLLKIVIEC